MTIALGTSPAAMLQLNDVLDDDSLGMMTEQNFSSTLFSEKFMMNVTQMLNISAENLTSLLHSVQQEMQLLEDGSNHNGIALAVTRTPMTLLALITICYALIFMAGVLGNLITCIVISRNNFMHTATNFYLFNLAISDLILLLSGMPQDLYNLWQPDAYPFADAVCVMESVLCETAANATVLTITAFTVERYIAICHPFRQHTMSKLSRAIKFIFAIWLMAFLLALPQAMQFSVVPIESGVSCTMNNDFFAHVFAVSGFIFFGGPMTAICVLYVLIGVKLKRSRLLQALPRRSFDINRGISAQTRVIRMLIAVAVAFFLCWAPFHAQRLMAVYGSTSGIDSQTFNDIFNVLNYTSGVLYFLSTCINPLLYNIMSHKFREAFKVTLARHFGLASKYQSKSQQHNYSALLRQHGSMRLHTTVNNNAFEQFGSYRVSVQFQCREASHHQQLHNLSLQDSVRTTTTTTTMSNGAGAASMTAARRSLQKNRFSIGSQSTLLTSLSKHDIYATQPASASTAAAPPPPPPHNRILQTQISLLSSLGDANSLLEVDIDNGQTHANKPHANISKDIVPVQATDVFDLATDVPNTSAQVHKPKRQTQQDASSTCIELLPNSNAANASLPAADVDVDVCDVPSRTLQPKSENASTFANFKHKFRWRTSKPKQTNGANK